MRIQLRRTVLLAVFAFAFVMAFSVCTYTAHADVVVKKDESQVANAQTLAEAVEAVNSASNIKDGDSVTFIIQGNTYPGNMPAFDKRVKLDIYGVLDNDDIVKHGDESINISNAASVEIRNLDLFCDAFIDDSMKASDVSIKRVNSYGRLEIRNAGSCSIDGTREGGSRSKVQELKVLGSTGSKVKVSVIKGIEAEEKGDYYPGYEISCAECGEISNINIDNNQLVLEHARVRKLSNVDITYNKGISSYADVHTTAFVMWDSLIDLMENCTIIANQPNTSEYNIRGRAFLADTTTLTSPDKAVGTMKNCIIYGPYTGMELRNYKCSIGTIDSCVIASKVTAILNPALGIFFTAANIDNITGDTVIFSLLDSPIYFEGTCNIESELEAADGATVGNVRIGTDSGKALFNGKDTNLPDGYSWRNPESIYTKKVTPAKLRPYFTYDHAVFNYISYKCRITYHEGAGTKKPGYDKYYQSEVDGGSYCTVKGFNSDYISGVDPEVVPNPMEWRYDPKGGVPDVEERLALRADKKSYDFYPNYDYNSMYKVEFVTGAGSKVETQQVFNDNVPRKPEEPTRPGAVFDGWYLDEGCTQRYDFSESLVGSVDVERTVKLYAKWELKDCKVTFNTVKNGGRPEDQQTVTVKWGSKVTKPVNDPVYSEGEAYKHFTGWYKTAGGTTEFNFDTEIKADTTIYACFEYNHSTVTINMDGGSVPDLNAPWVRNSAGNVVYSGKVDDPISYPWDSWYSSDEPRKDHYDYGGVYQDSTFTKPVRFEDRVFWVPPTTTYYVKFVPKDYTVRYYDVSYSEYKKDTSIKPIKEESLPYGSDITYVPEDCSDRFSEWNPYTYSYNSGFSHIENWNGKVAGMEMRLFMKENPKIIFHSDIAGTRVLERVYVRKGTRLDGYADRKAEQADYNFVGWTTKPKTDGEYSYKETLPDAEKDEDDREKYPYVGFFDFSGSMPAGDINLYPVLVRDRLRVNLNTNGGTLEKSQSPEFTVDINEKLRMKGLNSAVKAGYELDGWYTQSGVKWNEDWGVTPEYCLKDEDGKAVRNEEPGKNYCYYTVGLNAVWTPQEVTVEYKEGAHGKSDAPSAKTSLGKAVVLADAPAADHGYLFTGWKDGKGGMHSAGEEFLFDDWDLVTGGKLVFTAQYEEKMPENHTISFDTAGGSYVAPVIQAEGTDIDSDGISDPVRDGYEFKGWDPEIPETMPGRDMTCKAQWEQIIKQYTISFKTAGGSVVRPITADEGAELKKPADPKKEHYVFKDWTPAFPAVMPSKDVTLSAAWEPVVYRVTFDADGGRFGDGKGTQTVSGIYDAVLTVPDEPVRDRYSFSGWDSEIPAHITGDLTIRAKWTKTGPDDPKPEPEPEPKPTPEPGPEPKPAASEEPAAAVGSLHTIGTGTVRVISAESMTVSFVKANAAGSSIKVPDSVQIGNRTYTVTEIASGAFRGSKAKTVTVGANVKVIRSGAFRSSKATTLIVKTKKLTKARVKASLKGSKIKTVKVKVGSKKVNKKYVSKYKKIFTKKNAGRKVRVK